MSAVSFWWEQLGGSPPRRSALEGPRSADVCIVGAGYTGLWTAYSLLETDPSLNVVVLEAEHAGFGASGRNGGWLVGELSGSRKRWTAQSGHAATLALVRAIQATVDEVTRVTVAEGIDCDLVKGGSLQVAQTPTALAGVREHVDADHRFGLDETDIALLDREQTNSRLRIRNALGASYTPHCARIQPAKLVRGLAAAVEKRGAVIYESTPVTEIVPRTAKTPRGDVTARWVVRATEGYTAKLRGLHRLVTPINSAMIVTEPLSPDAWAEIGWAGCETLLNVQHLYTYLQRTADGRIAIGGRGIPYRFGSKTDREGPLAAKTQDELRRELVRLFGDAAESRAAAAWHGVLGVTRNWQPSVGADPSTGLAWALGYAGEGVAAANLAGRTLRDLLLGEDTELARLPWVGQPPRAWETEPVRYVGIHMIYALLRAADRIEARTNRSSVLATIGNKLSGRSH